MSCHIGNTHGFKKGNKLGVRVMHGMYGTPEYWAYNNAINRCSDDKREDWPDYGGRGIKFLFTSFTQFLAELGPRPGGMMLDRINNEGNYEPGNVRWATPVEQANNRRPRRYRRKPKCVGL